MKITDAVKLVNIYIQYYEDLQKLKKEYFKLEKKEPLLKIFNTIKYFDDEQYQKSRLHATQILINNELYDLINKIIRKAVKNKRFVVVGYNITTRCLFDAKVKILLLAEFEIHVA
ncbi:19528_t:CDS:2 [Cetraspora pellucida]|uniref:19528_t:CDS:1 n=1 Tax=Cetraspora pellucida TaxID=1433469 RepID=A0A9N9DU69_9GLOM|nr:19528_t:CDS:2 [Cetraspora pellucida]